MLNLVAVKNNNALQNFISIKAVKAYKMLKTPIPKAFLCLSRNKATKNTESPLRPSPLSQS